MNFICTKTELQEAISIAQKAITGKSSMPILNGLLITTCKNQIKLTGSDIDLSIETKINAEIKEEGSVVVDSRLFGEIIRKLPNDNINISTTENNSIEIICQKSKFNLIHMNAEDFPEIPNINENIIFLIPQKILKDMIKSTIFAAAQDETRPILTGILFEIKDKKIKFSSIRRI